MAAVALAEAGLEAAAAADLASVVAAEGMAAAAAAATVAAAAGAAGTRLRRTFLPRLRRPWRRWATARAAHPRMAWTGDD